MVQGIAGGDDFCVPLMAGGPILCQASAGHSELCDDEPLYLFSNFIVKSDGCF